MLQCNLASEEHNQHKFKLMSPSRSKSYTFKHLSTYIYSYLTWKLQSNLIKCLKVCRLFSRMKFMCAFVYIFLFVIYFCVLLFLFHTQLTRPHCCGTCTMTVMGYSIILKSFSADSYTSISIFPSKILS